MTGFVRTLVLGGALLLSSCGLLGTESGNPESGANERSGAPGTSLGGAAGANGGHDTPGPQAPGNGGSQAMDAAAPPVADDDAGLPVLADDDAGLDGLGDEDAGVAGF